MSIKHNNILLYGLFILGNPQPFSYLILPAPLLFYILQENNIDDGNFIHCFFSHSPSSLSVCQ